MGRVGAYASDKVLMHIGRLQRLRAGGHPAPVHLHLILSDLCNLDCPGCSYRVSGGLSTELFAHRDQRGEVVAHNPTRFLDTELALSVLHDCAAMGVRAIEVTGGGEPTVHRDASEIVAYAQKLGLDTAFVSNGVLLDRIWPGVIVDLQWLRVSVDAATAGTYALVRPAFSAVTNNFATVLRHIRWAVACRDEAGSTCCIGLSFVVQQDNWREILDATILARELGCDNIRIAAAFMPDGARYHAVHRDEAIALEQEAVRRFHVPGDFEVYAQFGARVEDMEHGPSDPRCGYQYLTTYLGADANLYRCCVTAYTQRGLLGNVRVAGGLRQLWESNDAQRRLRLFDARGCAGVCRFRGKLARICESLDVSVLPDPPTDVAHPYFV